MEELEKLYEGKAKQLHTADDLEVLRVEYKSTTTTGDGEKKEDFTGRGRLDNLITTTILDLLRKCDIDSHLTKRVDDTGQLVYEMNMFPLEIMLHNVAASHFCPRLGMKEGLPFKEPVFECLLKNSDLYDPFVDDDNLVALGIYTREDLIEIAPLTREINEALIEIFAKVDVELVDSKIEMSHAANGMLLLTDEITLDSCRLWDQKDYPGRVERPGRDLFRHDLDNIIPTYEKIEERLTELAESEDIGVAE